MDESLDDIVARADAARKRADDAACVIKRTFHKLDGALRDLRYALRDLDDALAGDEAEVAS